MTIRGTAGDGRRRGPVAVTGRRMPGHPAPGARQARRDSRGMAKPPASAERIGRCKAPIAGGDAEGLCWGGVPARYGGTGPGSWRCARYCAWRSRSVSSASTSTKSVSSPAGDDRVGPLEEVGDLLDRRLEVGLAEGRGQLDVQHAARRAVRGAGRRPDDDVAEALAALDAAGQQVSREDPLHRLVEPDVERDADRVRVFLGVVTGSPRAARSSAGERPAVGRVLPKPCCCCSSSVQPQSAVGPGGEVRALSFDATRGD